MTSVDQSSLQTPEFKKLRDYLINLVTRELEIQKPSLIDRDTVVNSLVNQAYENTKLQLSPQLKDQLLKSILDEILGYGPIQPLINDPEISEIMVNGYNKIYIERHGRIEKSNITFENDEHVRQIIERIVLPLGRRIDADYPAVDSRLPDGSRVNAIVPPIAIDGPCITIRKFEKVPLEIEDLIKLGSITRNMADFLRACVISRRFCQSVAGYVY